MKIHFTKKEYQTLLDILYMTDWVLHAHQEEAAVESAHYRELMQKILAEAQAAGLEDLVDYKESAQTYVLNRNFMERSSAAQQMAAFENATFWEELVERLARRDFLTEYGKEEALKMPLTERIEKEGPFLKHYDGEFGLNGLKNLYICPPEKTNE
ncbi:hypothetical protein [Azotosporobacter soli]|uniref:hypothetical protein n=1 Tax=Azotosporobacter soli TaxID=3055040 RepID=UPI0031FE8277